MKNSLAERVRRLRLDREAYFMAVSRGDASTQEEIEGALSDLKTIIRVSERVEGSFGPPAKRQPRLKRRG